MTVGKCQIKTVLNKRLVQSVCGIDVSIDEATAWSSDVGCAACLALIVEGRAKVAAQNTVGKPLTSHESVL